MRDGTTTPAIIPVSASATAPSVTPSPMSAVFPLCAIEQNILLNAIHDGIWVIDAKGITLRINKAMERIADIRHEDVVGKHVEESMRTLKFTTCVTLQALKKKEVITMFDDYANGRRCLNTSTPILDEHGEVWRVIACIRDITELEFMTQRLAELERSNEHYKTQLLRMEQAQDHGIMGNSEATVALRRDIFKAAKNDTITLILGETGTGKSLTAKAIHKASARKDGPFVALNCGGIPSSLIESELFGYSRGAFTGAAKEGKKGVFELAHGGTLFLDEIAEMPLAAQATLLHVLDDFTFKRVGGTHDITSDVRIIAATNKCLEDLVQAHKFRQDLFYRLRVLVVNIPPLRKRREDIPLLAQYFLHTYGGEHEERSFAPATLNTLVHYAWPGNVRELRALVQYLHAMCDERMFGIEHLPTYIQENTPQYTVHDAQPQAVPRVDEPEALLQHASLKDALEDVEKKLIVAALQSEGSTYKAAKKLGVSQSSVVRKAQKYGL